MVTRSEPDDLDALLDGLDLKADLEDVEFDREQLRLLKMIVRSIGREGDRLVALIDDVNALVAQTGADAQAAADRVLAAITAAVADAQAQITALQEQVQTLIDGNAGDITTEQLQSVADGLTGIDDTVKGIAPETT